MSLPRVAFVFALTTAACGAPQGAPAPEAQAQARAQAQAQAQAQARAQARAQAPDPPADPRPDPQGKAPPDAGPPKPACPDGEVPIPATGPDGFTMGRGVSDKDAPHKVILSRGFCLDANEVTARQYAECVDAKKCDVPGQGDQWATYKRYPDHPIDLVTWDMSRDYCGWVGKGWISGTGRHAATGNT